MRKPRRSSIEAKFLQLSVRAATWLGAELLDRYCEGASLQDFRIDEFSDHLRSVVISTDIPGWDESFRSLEVSGIYSDGLPSGLEDVGSLFRIVEAVHEISMSQIYGAWQPTVVAQFLIEAQRLAEIEVDPVQLAAALTHDPGENGWGSPLATLPSW